MFLTATRLDKRSIILRARVAPTPRPSIESLETRLLMHANRGLTGLVYCDENHNLVKDSLDTPLVGVVVTLTGVNDQNTVINQNTTTDLNGAYGFFGLRPGTYKLTETPPAGDTNEVANVGIPFAGTAAPGGGMISNLILPPDAQFDAVTGINYNFGLNCPSMECPPTSITSNFNGTGINAGNTIWFNSVFKATGLSTIIPTTLRFLDQSISFSVNGTAYNLKVPDAIVTLTPGSNTASTVFDSVANAWKTSVPTSSSGNVFLSGLGYKVPSFIPGGAVKSITWTGTFEADKPGISVNWQWGAAVYTQFAGNSAIGVKPLDDNHFGPYFNSDHAGTPENEKAFVIGGARGGGGSNFTGSYSATGHSGACFMIPGPTVKAGISINAGGGAAGSFVGDTGFTGGQTFTTNSPISTAGVFAPAPQSVYQTERFGSSFSYKATNLTPGAVYLVRLHFAENFVTGPNQRLFNVAINGTTYLNNFDIFAAAGAMHKAYVANLGTHADASGAITITFTSVVQLAKVDGIEIIAV
jgi:malectin (di-glucose binding ER protein)/SdrD B-like protein